jgi:hypothetical protein
MENIPPRTVAEEHLSFGMKATLDLGSSIFFPHLKVNPADLKVILSVSIFSIS